MNSQDHSKKSSSVLKIYLILFLFIFALAAGIWQVWGFSTTSSRASRITTAGVHQTDIRGGKIILSVPMSNIDFNRVPLKQESWTVVQWQTADGRWIDVGGWQGSFYYDQRDNRQFVEWWVGEEILGEGPFRWVIYSDKSRSRRLSITQSFNLPSNNRESIVVVPSFQTVPQVVQQQVTDEAFADAADNVTSVAIAQTDQTENLIQSAGNSYFVSVNGDNSDGLTWDTAWNELDQIDWEVIRPGDRISLDGGQSNQEPMVYRTTLSPTASGSVDQPILIQLSAESGRNGQAVLFGGNGVLLPECGQKDWDGSQHAEAGESAIKFGNGVSNIVVDGRKRRGLIIFGWKKNGINFDPDRIDNGVDDNTKNITLRYMEIFNNGNVLQKDDGSSMGLYFPDNGSPGIKLSGVGHTFEFLEIHDNAADGIQSNFTNPDGGVFNNMEDFTLTDSWIYNQRVHSGADNSPLGEVCSLDNPNGCDELGAPEMAIDYLSYPSEPTFRQEAFNWCTHNDGIQIFSSNDFNQLTIERSIIGPNLMNGLLLGDRNGPTTTAWVNDLTLRDVVITRFAHSALGMKNPPEQAGKNWNLENVTIYGHFSNTNKGTLNIDSNADQADHRIVNSTMVFGRTEFPNDNIEFENNCQFALYSGSLGGNDVDPEFVSINERDIFENNIAIDFSTVFTDDYTPLNSDCLTSASRTTSVNVLLSRFNTE